MKLETSIRPRKDGTVIANLPDKAKYEFKPGTDGALECEVDNDAHASWLIGTGNFYPAEAADFDEAAELLSAEAKAEEEAEAEAKSEDEAQAQAEPAAEKPKGKAEAKSKAK
jgi:hypothetical protein